MKIYEVAVIMTLRTKTYEEALEGAEEVINACNDEFFAGSPGENMRVVKDYDLDNEYQRVVYLPEVDE